MTLVGDIKQHARGMGSELGLYNHYSMVIDKFKTS